MAGSALVGVFADGTPRAMAFVIGACAIASLLCTLMIPTVWQAADSSGRIE